jgi:hypothetical protein
MFMPLYAIIILINFNPYINQSVSIPLQKIIYSIVFVFTILLPLLTALALKRLKIVESIYMRKTQERRWPFALTILWYYLCFEILLKLNLPASFYLMMIGAIVVIAIALLITFFWKISVHMLGIGGLLGATIAISFRFQLDLTFIIVGAVLVAGLIGYARLKTKSHSYKQVYIGFIIGVITEFFAVFL